MQSYKKNLKSQNTLWPKSHLSAPNTDNFAFVKLINTQMAENVQQQVSEPATEAPVTETPETQETVSARDRFRRDYAERYPDEDLSDDEAYVNHLSGRLKERDGYEESFNNLTNAIGNSSEFVDMVEAAKADKTGEFDPVLWLVSNGRLDLEALQNDPEYAKKLAEAQKTSLEKKAKLKEIEQQSADNFQPSVDAINSVTEELGLSEEERNQVIASMYQVMDDLLVNKIDADNFRMFAQGLRHEGDVSEARENGYAEGLAQKVSNKVRSMPQQNTRMTGRQMSQPEATEKESSESNMFGV